MRADTAGTALRPAWYRVEPPPDGAPVTVRNGPQELVVWATADGVHALDAWCPHRGAHLGGGQVADGAITCPLHGWRWSGAGENLGTGTGPPLPEARCATVPAVVGPSGPLVWLSPARPDRADHDAVDLGRDLPAGAEAAESHWIDLDGIDPALVIENAFDLAHVAPVHGQAGPTPAHLAIDGDRASIEHRSPEGGPVTRFTAYRASQLLVRVGTARADLALWVLFTVDAGPRRGATLRYFGEGPGARAALRRFARHHRRELATDLALFRSQRPDQGRFWGPEDGPLRAFRAWVDQFGP